MIVIGTFFAVIIAKHIYGGLGQNPFNPAMVGYVVLLISFPVQMTSWLPPESANHPVSFSDSLHVIFTGLSDGGLTLEQLRAGADGMSQGDPARQFQTGLLTRDMSEILTQPVLQGSVAGIGWQWVNIGYLIGGCILLNHASDFMADPAAMLGTLAVLSVIGYLIDSSHFTSPVIQLFSGATMLGAFFIATDPVTASHHAMRGRLDIRDALIGLLLWIIPCLRRLSGCGGICRPAGNITRAADRYLYTTACLRAQTGNKWCHITPLRPDPPCLPPVPPDWAVCHIPRQTGN